MIYPCKCKHTTQDELYGAGNRVHNAMKDAGKYRCTVCSNEKTVSTKKDDK